VNYNYGDKESAELIEEDYILLEKRKHMDDFTMAIVDLE